MHGIAFSLAAGHDVPVAMGAMGATRLSQAAMSGTRGEGGIGA